MSSTVEVEPRADRSGRIETHGTDYVPDAERHGRPRSLFAIWAASNITYLYVVLGGLMVMLGLNLWQAGLVIVAGNLFWIAVGFVAISGPAAGTPSEIITRAMYGVRGNRVYTLILGWVVGVAYEAINLATGSLAGFALVHYFFGAVPLWSKAAIIVGTAVVTFTIAVLGHATIQRLSGGFTWLLFAALVVLGWFVVRHTDFHYATPANDAVHGWALWAVALVGFAIIAACPLSWGTSADFSRYLPAASSPRAVMGWTFLGSFLPSVVLSLLGAFAATAVDMTDPQTSLEGILPSWFYAAFLGMIIVGLITNNVLTAYSTGLALQAAGVPWRRSVTVVFDAAVAVGVTGYALFVTNFLDAISSILTLTVALLGPAMAIYVIDIVRRRNRYDHTALADESPSSPFWYHRGWNWAGIVALVAGAAAATLCIDTTPFTGPVSAALGGADLSAIVGPLVGGVAYGVLSRITAPRAVVRGGTARRAGSGTRAASS
ncbi:nitrate reductase [Frondihabitans sp. PAMC 28766]|uniref:purine-cytosine permease family protein n=1 Tax=Frondihabitans sp. PAMC 28766 TaxID=1795630 RepID=UPI00078B6F89|nr:cytosine permease [Frondihabitans sp. PAMC 28766]AMM21410.1 nitrate reductase [Frondihabitans sp. PAMC 28766]